MEELVSKERTRNYLRQIKGAVVYRAVAMGASFLAIPLMIGYLGQEQFGVWSTLLTVMSWLVFFDLGVGNGLRNKVAESLAKNIKGEAGNYVASGYTLIGLIALGLWVVVTLASYIIPWQTVFNTRAISEAELRFTAQIVSFFILLNFWVGLIGALLGAVQKTSLVALGQLIANMLILGLLLVLTRTTDSAISWLAMVYGVSLVSANILLSLWFYRRYPELRPRPSLDRRHVSPLLALGLQFFVIQLAVLVIFTTDKMLITQLFGPQHVTPYEVVFKLFSVITFIHALISAPLWSAYTEAYHRGDFVWIKFMLRKQLLIFGVIWLLGIALLLSSKAIIVLWIGQELEVSWSLLAAMGFFVLIVVWNNIYAVFVNGIGKIRVQLYTAVVAMLVNIPLSVFFAKYLGLGLSGIVMGTICGLLLAAVALPVQVHRLIGARIKEQIA
ncbi:lipopolysaccharide biosynthesis protein [Desulfurivibrio sp. D14AmB]|uniref:lipopolysaccharide biosynthesis protein n=1 Tax=Desulfurivibrio sp. D14AmB TaxID=3374370 RepID=UPI00376ECA52